MSEEQKQENPERFQIIKIDITSMCDLGGYPEIKRVFNAYAASRDVRTFCCSATPMVFCVDLGVELEFFHSTPERLKNETESMFYGCSDNTYLDKSTVDRFPKMEWGDIPPDGETGCVIETEETDIDELIENYFAEGG